MFSSQGGLDIVKAFSWRVPSLVSLAALLLVAVLLGARGFPAEAATFTVTTTVDSNDGTCGAHCSLREAIASANETGGDDTIELPPGTYTLSIAGAGEESNESGDLDITSTISIAGAGAETTIIDGAGLDRVIDVRSGGGALFLSGLTVRGGNNVPAPSDGGGIRVTNGSLTLADSAVSGNTAGNLGGGIYNQGGTVSIVRSTVSGNTAGSSGGGIAVVGIDPTFELINGTVSGNAALGNGGGGMQFTITSDENPLMLTNGTITENTNGGLRVLNTTSVSLKNVIVGNQASGPDCSGTFTSVGNNIDSDSTCNLIDPSDQPGADALLGTLQENGGQTETHALLVGSPAIDAGDDAACPAVDQRGVSRPQGEHCDIGAYEAEEIGTATPTATPTPTPSPTPTPTPTPTLVLNVVGDLQAQAQSQNEIVLFWTDNSIGEDGYEIERSTEGGAFTHVATLPAESNVFQDLGLTADTIYAYRVRAFNGTIFADWSNVAIETTLPDIGVPSPTDFPFLLTPTDVTASSQCLPDYGVLLTWTDNANVEDRYIIERSTTPDFSDIWDERFVLPADSQQYLDDGGFTAGLIPGTVYYYRIWAQQDTDDGALNSGYGFQSTVTQHMSGAPLNLEATAVSSNRIDLTWEAPDDACRSGYLIYGSRNGRDFFEGSEVGPDETFFADTEFLPTDSTFHYKVRPYIGDPDSFGLNIIYGDFSNEASATLLPPPVAGPSGLTANAVSTPTQLQIELNWTDNSDNEEGFELQVSFVSTFRDDWSIILPADTTSYTHEFLFESRRYYYRVRAFNHDFAEPYGEEYSPFSNRADDRTGTLPDPPACDSGNRPDTDGDGLLDCWETDGLDVDGDNVVDVDLPGMGAHPLRKDLYVEFDCLVATDHTHCPREQGMLDVAQSFADAPVLNPDGTTGVQLHIDSGALYGSDAVTQLAGGGGVVSTVGDLGGGGEAIPEAGNEIIDWDGDLGRPATNFYSLKESHFSSARAAVFRYAIFGHQTNARQALYDCTAGWADGIPGNDMMITLGGQRDLDGDLVPDVPCWEPTASNGIDDDGDGLIDEDPWDGIDNDGDCPGDTDGDGRVCDRYDIGVDEDSGHSVGSLELEAGTFMHELGHLLGLKHGGEDHVNYKPNYLSVMNYWYASCDVPSSAFLPGGCDYSRIELSQLDETSLDECFGIDGGALGFGPLNWNRNSDGDGAPILEGATCPSPNDTNVQADINYDGFPSGRHNSFDDWSNVVYEFYTLATAANGIAFPVEDELHPQIVDEAEKRLAEFSAPLLTVTKTGPDFAAAGDSITYVIRVRNDGAGPALGVEIIDLLPDGSELVIPIGTLVAGGEVSRLVTFEAPDSSAGSLITNSVVVNYAGLSGEGNQAMAFHNLEMTCVEDVTRDGFLDVRDLTAIAMAMNSEQGDDRWVVEADTNGDGRVDRQDMKRVVAAFRGSGCG